MHGSGFHACEDVHPDFVLPVNDVSRFRHNLEVD